MDELISSLGANPVPFPLRDALLRGFTYHYRRRTGAGFARRRILESATSNGAQCLITACPLCQMNLDAYQGKVKKKFKTNYNLPILYFTQLMGIAFGLSGIDIGLKLGIINSEEVLAKYL